MRVLEVFAPLFGQWQGAEEHLGSSWGPATTARAILSFRAEVGGAAMVSDYRQVRADAAEYLGHGVFLVDDALEVSWWLFDSHGHPPVPATGGWRRGELVLTRTGTTERRAAIHRFGIDGHDLTYAIDVSVGDSEPEPALRGRYRAISTH